MIIPYEDKNFKQYKDRIILSERPVLPPTEAGIEDCVVWLNIGNAVICVRKDQICADGKTIYGMFGNIDFACYYIEAEDAKLVETPAIDYVDHPNHYQSSNGMEVIDVIDAFTENLTGVVAFDIGCAIKYMCRWKKKNGTEDLRKAIWYLQHAIKKTEGVEDGSVHSGQDNR